MTERAQISKEISDLYAIRSKIVHNGYRQVTDAETARIKIIVAQVIFRMLRSRTLAKFSSRQELAQWFEGKVLS
jgi:hypothetical protein